MTHPLLSNSRLYLALFIALPLLNACEKSLVTPDKTQKAESNAFLRTSYTSFAALAHLQAQARSAEAARATTIAYDMHQAATGLDGVEDAYGSSTLEDACTTSGVKQTQYNVNSPSPLAGDTITTRQIGCSYPYHVGAVIAQMVSNSESNWQLVSGSISDYNDLDLAIKQETTRIEQTGMADDIEHSVDITYAIRREAQSNYFSISEGAVTYSALGNTSIHSFEETETTASRRRSYNMSFEFTPTGPLPSDLNGYSIATLSPTLETYSESSSGDSETTMSSGKVRIQMSNDSVIEYSALGSNQVLITFDENTDGTPDTQETLDYDSFLERAYQNPALSSLSTML